MSQNSRRGFLTSAAAVAAALAACAAPGRRAQAQACATIYDEGDIVHKIAPYLGDIQNDLITFPVGTSSLSMTNLLQNPQFVNNTLKALTVTLPALGGQA